MGKQITMRSCKEWNRRGTSVVLCAQLPFYLVFCFLLFPHNLTQPFLLLCVLKADPIKHGPQPSVLVLCFLLNVMPTRQFTKHL